MSEDTKKLSEEVKLEYTSSLADLTFNSKPLINMLTMLAEENITYAGEIVEAIEKHLCKVETDVKLPILYLVDCIVKNVGGTYTNLFSQNIVSTFCSVFKVVDEKTRGEMFKLRQTWNDVFPQKKLYAIDVQIRMLDPAWPVTAQPPGNSIHFNPKFLQNQTAATKPLGDINPIVPPIIPVSTVDTVDSKTLSMQQTLIMKQKELLELQQKKLELELLQNQMKLQEQMHVNVKGRPPGSQNILVKREVANQLMPHLQPTQANMKIRPPSTMANAVMFQRLQQSAAAMTGVPKINPVSSQLLAATKPIRDPRILRQQQQQLQQQLQREPPKHPITSSSSQIESKSAILDSTNKVINSKLGVRNTSRTDPRLVNNKDSSLSQSKNAIARVKPTRVTSSQKSFRSSRSKPPSNSFSSDSKSSLSKGSSSSLDSPTKSKSEKSETRLSKSPVKHKKKDSPIKSDKSDKDKIDKLDKKSCKDTKRDRDSSKSQQSETVSPPSLFKGVKGSKNRNYIRRNRSPSPEPTKDVDLRVSGPPEKHPRLQTETSDEQTSNGPVSSQNKDVDLRQMPAVTGKKRLSTETPEPLVPKKTKTEILDELFGNEDTDLRQLPIVTDRPKTPPPPIISSSAEEEIKKEIEPPTKPNLDALRAKLAMATNRQRIPKISPKPDLMFGKKDEDLRSKSTPDAFDKIIISPEDEKCIKEGKLSNEQGQQIMHKIFAQIENQKLREAQKKDKEDSLMNVSLQPISDDEFETSDNDEELKKQKVVEIKEDKDERLLDKDERLAFDKSQRVLVEKNTEPSPLPVLEDRLTGDKDERIPPPHMPYDDPQCNFRDIRDTRDMRRGINWRGRRRPWDVNVMPHGRPPIRPRMNPPVSWRGMPPSAFNRNQIPDFDINNGHFPNDNTGKKSPDVPEKLVVESVHPDDNKTMHIDGIARDIRYYDETAIVFMNWDDPREISFQDGERRVIFGDQDCYLLYFNQPAKEVMINGSLHLVKLGAPTREIIVDGKPYECYFGGPGIVIYLNGHPTSLKLEGPPPQVKIGTVKRNDLVLAKISLIIDAKIVVPVFLDAKVQKFLINGETNTLRFVDGLKGAFINDVKMNTEFGGLPKPIVFRDKKYYVRFTVLPRGVKPGQVYIKDMEGCGVGPSPAIDENSQDMHPIPDTNEPALPILPRKRLHREDSPDSNSNPSGLFQNLMHNPNISNLDVLSSQLMSSMGPAPSSSTTGYSVENMPPIENQPNQVQTPPKPALPLNLDINELFQKLVSTGIVTTNKSSNPVIPTLATTQKLTVKPESEIKTGKRHSIENLKPITFDKPETLKIRQPMLYDIIYSGMQCSSCGMRFPPEQSIQYSQHLDWHFRQNRKGKRNSRVAASRQWYYGFQDWKNYEEIEDLEEREKNFFDQQQVEGMLEEAEEDVEVPSVPTIPEIPYARCDVCMEIFDQFFNEEKEEWHLRNALRIDDKTYHPVCYEDYLASLVDTSVIDDSKTEELVDTNTEDEQIPGLEVVTLDDDDEDEEIESKEKEVILGESDESKPVDENSHAELESSESPQYDEDDDDVIINEVIPEKIVVDDDDDDMLDDGFSNLSSAETASRPPLIDDGFMDPEDALPALKGCSSVTVKQEPLDAEDITAAVFEEQAPAVESQIEEDKVMEEEETDRVPLVGPPISRPGIDGNVELGGAIPTASISNKIKINISKPISVISPKEPAKEDSVSDNLRDILLDPSQPLPPGEEPPVQLNLKPALQGVVLNKLPPVQKGSELTGMCSIM